MERVLVLGAGGFSREVLDVVLAKRAAGEELEPLGFVDDSRDSWGTRLNGFLVLGGLDWLESQKDEQIRVICGIGNPAARKGMVSRAKDIGASFTNLVHPSAVMTEFVTMGSGVVVTAGCILTNQITIGNHVHLNLGATVGHDCQIADLCTIAPGVHLSGNVRLGEGCDIGTGAVILQGVTIGQWSIVGAGAVVTKDIPPHTTSVGVPAKVIRRRDAGSSP